MRAKTTKKSVKKSAKKAVRKTTKKSTKKTAKKSTKKSAHLSKSGRVQMVPVSDKPVTLRHASALAVVEMEHTTWHAIAHHKLGKGDALATIRLAAIQGAKRTPDLIPLCHPLPLSEVALEIIAPTKASQAKKRVRVGLRASCSAKAQTGVEMEAMVAATTAALTLYDFCKSVERSVTIVEVALEEKVGGKSGRWKRKGKSAL